LALSYLKFVVGPKCVGQFAGVDHPAYNDLIQAGIEGVFKAMTMFDYQRGVRFLSYARARITLHIRQELSRKEVVSVPAWRRRAKKLVQRVRDDWVFQHGSEPSDEHLCEYSRLTPRQLQRIQSEDFSVCSVEHIVPVAAPEVDPDVVEDASRVKKLVSKLPRYHQFITRSLYGLSNGVPYTVKDLAEILGRSSAWVSRCRREALAFLQEKAVTAR